jgi:hypothetical protein
MARNITERSCQKTLRYEWEWIACNNPFPEYPKVGLNRFTNKSENLLAILYYNKGHLLIRHTRTREV